MNFYKRFIGDYGRKTAHLSLLEHGVYAALLDHYYGIGKPLPDDMPALYRICRAVDQPEQVAVQRVVNEFFPVGSDGLRHNPRADQEIAEAAAFADAQAMRAHKRWHKQADMPDGCPDDASHSHSHSQNPQPEEKNSNACALEGVGKPPPCPHEAIIALYHEMLPTNPRVKTWTPQRQGNLRQRWREYPTLDEWRAFFKRVSESAFLTGRATPRGDRKPFVASLDWLIKPENFAKVLEGKYAG